MSASPPGPQAQAQEEDHNMQEQSPPPSSDEGDAIDLRPGAGGDSSEEEQTDSEEEREVRKGFIVDEDDRRKKRSKKKKRSKREGSGEGAEGGSRKRRKDSDDEAGDLDEDDLDLLEENMGFTRSKPKSGLKRLRRRQRSGSASSSGSGRNGGPSGADLRDIFNDPDVDAEEGGDSGRGAAGGSSRRKQRGGDEVGAFNDDEMAGFIEDDSDEDGSERGGSDSEGGGGGESKRRRKERKKRERKEQAKKRRGLGMGRVEGITSEAWGEVAEVFGNGQDYGWAMEDEDEGGAGARGEDGEEKAKELKDIFEPSEIASRMLTEGDEKIRTTDIPERLQLTNVGLPPFSLSPLGDLNPLIPLEDIPAAALWMAEKLPKEHTAPFLLKDDFGNPQVLYDEFIKSVENVVRFLNVEFLEPPHIWHHKADYLFHAPSGTEPRALLSEVDVWALSRLSVKYRAYQARKDELMQLWRSLGVQDSQAEDVLEQLQSGEEVADAVGWIGVRWSERAREAKGKKRDGAAGEEEEANGGIKDEAGGVKRPKRARQENAYEVAKASVVKNLAAAIAISPTAFALDLSNQYKTAELDDPDKMPSDLADEYSGLEPFETREKALEAAKMILSTEIAAEPLVRKEVRRYFRDFAVVNVEATKLGESKIDNLNPFYAFKYLSNKPLSEFSKSPQWLLILAAESAGLVTASITLPPTASAQLFDSLAKIYCSDYVSALAEEWNDLRRDVLKKALEAGLMREGESHVRGLLKEGAEEIVAESCRRKLESRVDAAPWCRGDGTMEPGQIPSVLALSNGNGDARRDNVVAVFLDSDGHFREHLVLDKLNNLESNEVGAMEESQRDAFTELLRRRRPQVVVVGGFRPATVTLMDEFRRFGLKVSQQLVNDGHADDEDEDADPHLTESDRERRREERAAFESTYVFDDVARIYQNSPRAAQEFTELSTLGKYCVGLARYIQSPLNEYAALGADLSALNYDSNQKYLSKDKVIEALERTLIELTNRVGVDVNKAVRNPYYSHLLPYVSGLGPRKAASVVKKINAQGGTLATRSGLVIHQIMTKNVWVNASAFLRIRQDDLAADLGRDTEADEDPDVLDDTRIHPEDYDVARKMAADAMEYDEEDLEGGAPSKAVVDLFDDDVKKLNELALDEFAEELSKVLQQPKRLTLYRIREELQRPFAEKRATYEPPNDMERFMMFTGETKATLDQGLIIPVRVLRVAPDETVIVRLDCGVEGNIQAEFRTDGGNYSKLRPGQTLQAVVMDVKYREMKVELTTGERILSAGDAERRQVRPDMYFDKDKAARASRSAGQEKQKATGRVKRMINHPNFQDVSSGKAEEFLSNMQRGDCVIRPSSREDHLAVTWKVDEGLYQHIAVHELNKPSEYGLGTQLRISDRHRYSDLDELIDAHIKQMSRKVTEMTNNEKFKGKKDVLDKFLGNWTLANPGKSIYAFGWDDNRRKPGDLLLGFKTNENAPVQYWNVSVVPEGYVLKGVVHGDVQSLINAFKTAYAYSTSGAARLANPNAGGRTGLPQQQGRTPAHPSGRTPAPNPYAQQGGRTPAGGYAQQGGRTPAGGYGQQQQQPGGGRTPAPGAYGGGYGGGATPNPAYGGGGGGGGYGQLPPGVAAAQQAAAQQAIPGFGGGRTPNIYGPPAGGRSPGGGVGGGGMTPGGYGRGY